MYVLSGVSGCVALSGEWGMWRGAEVWGWVCVSCCVLTGVAGSGSAAGCVLLELAVLLGLYCWAVVVWCGHGGCLGWDL